MAHMVETMMYRGELPWHGLGTELPEDRRYDLDEAIRLAGLDWSVSLDQLRTSDNRPVDRYACIRSTDNRILGTVGPDFTPVQNADAFEFFRPFVDSHSAALESAGSLKEGARVWVLAKANLKDSVIVPQADDRVAKYLLLAHAHDGSMAVRCGLTPIRVVCHNTLTAAFGDSGSALIRVKHTRGVSDALNAAQEAIARADHSFERAAEVFRALAAKPVSAKQIRAYLDAVFPSTAKKDPESTPAPVRKPVAPARARGGLRLVGASDTPAGNMFEDASRAAGKVMEILESGGRGLDLPGVKGTAWSAYNAVTEYLSWEHGRNQDNRLNNAWFSDALPKRALNAAIGTFLAAA